MTWNYRVIEHDAPESDLGNFGIHEVHYDEEGRVTTWTENAVAVAAETVEALGEELDIMRQALAKPVLKESELLRDLESRK
ncbi:MAG: hypothetical protein L0Z62_25470 [Gemmataceae bacterium]|nr:hypothetical protein [Gemmataceae bacterium]